MRATRHKFKAQTKEKNTATNNFNFYKTVGCHLAQVVSFATFSRIGNLSQDLKK